MFPTHHDRGPGNDQEYDADVDPRECRNILQMQDL